MFIFLKICLFIFYCGGSLLLHQLSLVAVRGGYSLVAVLRLLIAVDSFAVERGL